MWPRQLLIVVLQSFFSDTGSFKRDGAIIVLNVVMATSIIVCKLHKLLITTVGSGLCSDGLTLNIITACSLSNKVGRPSPINIVNINVRISMILASHQSLNGSPRSVFLLFDL